MSDTTEFCERCDGYIWYPTDHLGRVVAVCERCGHRPPAFVARAIKPLAGQPLRLVRPTPERPAPAVPVWKFHQIRDWLKERLAGGPILRSVLVTMAERERIPEPLLRATIRELVTMRQLRRDGSGRLSLGTPKGLQGQLLAWVEEAGRPVSATEVWEEGFPQVAINAVRAGLANLVAAGRLNKGGPDGARRYWAAKALLDDQEAA